VKLELLIVVDGLVVLEAEEVMDVLLVAVETGVREQAAPRF
jgi:hypothetical protein